MPSWLDDAETARTSTAVSRKTYGRRTRATPTTASSAYSASSAWSAATSTVFSDLSNRPSSYQASAKPRGKSRIAASAKHTGASAGDADTVLTPEYTRHRAVGTPASAAQPVQHAHAATPDSAAPAPAPAHTLPGTPSTIYPLSAQSAIDSSEDSDSDAFDMEAVAALPCATTAVGGVGRQRQAASRRRSVLAAAAKKADSSKASNAAGPRFGLWAALARATPSSRSSAAEAGSSASQAAARTASRVSRRSSLFGTGSAIALPGLATSARRPSLLLAGAHRPRRSSFMPRLSSVPSVQPAPTLPTIAQEAAGRIALPGMGLRRLSVGDAAAAGKLQPLSMQPARMPECWEEVAHHLERLYVPVLPVLCAARQEARQHSDAALPSTVLASIMDFLTPAEAAVAATVCRAWSISARISQGRGTISAIKQSIQSTGSRRRGASSTEASTWLVQSSTPLSLSFFSTLPWAQHLASGGWKSVHRAWHVPSSSWRALALVCMDDVLEAEAEDGMLAETEIAALVGAWPAGRVSPFFVSLHSTAALRAPMPASLWGASPEDDEQQQPLSKSGAWQFSQDAACAAAAALRAGEVLDEPAELAAQAEIAAAAGWRATRGRWARARQPAGSSMKHWLALQMELCDGDAEDWLAAQPAPSACSPMQLAQTALGLVVQGAAALHTAHEVCGLVHFDVKMLNFLVQGASAAPVQVALPSGHQLRLPGGTTLPRLKLTDFGTSELQTSPEPVAPWHLTTWENVAPEVLLHGDGAVAGPAMDAWGLGLCALHALFRSGPYEEVMASVQAPAAFVRAIRKAWKQASLGRSFEVLALALQDDPEHALPSTLWRYMALFGEPPARDAPSATTAAKLVRAVCSGQTAGRVAGLSTVAVQELHAAFLGVHSAWSVVHGSHPAMVAARAAMEAWPALATAVYGLCAWSAEDRLGTDVVAALPLGSWEQGTAGEAPLQFSAAM